MATSYSQRARRAKTFKIHFANFPRLSGSTLCPQWICVKPTKESSHKEKIIAVHAGVEKQLLASARPVTRPPQRSASTPACALRVPSDHSTDRKRKRGGGRERERERSLRLDSRGAATALAFLERARSHSALDRACELIQMLPPLQERTSNRPSEGRDERGLVAAVVVFGRSTARPGGRLVGSALKSDVQQSSRSRNQSEGRAMAKLPLESFIVKRVTALLDLWRQCNGEFELTFVIDFLLKMGTRI